MCMAVDDRLAAWEPPDETLAPTDRGPRNVNHPDSRPGSVDHPVARKLRPYLRVVSVAEDGRDRRSNFAQPIEKREPNQVAGMQDQLRPAQPVDAFDRKRPPAARHVRIGDDGDPHLSAAEGLNGRKLGSE